MECNIKCGGYCCQAFTLPFSMEEFQEDAAKARAGGEHRWKDVETFVEHLVYLGRKPYGSGNEAAAEVAAHKARCTGRGMSDDEALCHYYTCNKFDLETGLCTIYDARPYFCREYPNSGVCSYAACPERESQLRVRDEHRAELEKKVVDASKKLGAS